jgi:hypothetical protein
VKIQPQWVVTPGKQTNKHAPVGRISHNESSVHGHESFKNKGNVFLENVGGRLTSKAKSCLRGT